MTNFIQFLFGRGGGPKAVLQFITVSAICVFTTCVLYLVLQYSLSSISIRNQIALSSDLIAALEEDDEEVGDAVEGDVEVARVLETRGGDFSVFYRVLTKKLPGSEEGTVRVDGTPHEISICGARIDGAPMCSEPAGEQSEYVVLFGVVLSPVALEEAEPADAPASSDAGNEDTEARALEPLTLPVVVRSNRDLAYFVSVEHSIHSVMRQYEALVFNEEGTPFSAMRLCEGTRRILPPEECEVSQMIEDNLGVLVDDVSNGALPATLLLGPIQFLTLFTFVFIGYRVLGIRLLDTSSRSVFLDMPKQEGDTESHARLSEMDEAELRDRIDHFKALTQKSVRDDMIAHAILFRQYQMKSRAPMTATRDEEGRLQSPTLDGFRDVLLEEADTAIAPLESVNETMLKLAFIGTIIGIALALVTARSLDAANPVDEILTKAGMFAAIGSAFGTTLFGVALSIAAAFMIQSASDRWRNQITSSYRVALEQTGGMTARLSEDSLQRIIDIVKPDPPRPTDPFRALGAALIVIISLGTFAAALVYFDIVDIQGLMTSFSDLLASVRGGVWGEGS
jgi:hypothetical protein